MAKPVQGDCDLNHRDLLVRADSLCSLVYYRECSGLSDETMRDLSQLVVDLRTATKAMEV